ncbi:MAG: hypothetical protein IJN29_03505 [Akkermansia sp.]|nr:hypothetical protein [Akkermansia sp.]
MKTHIHLALALAAAPLCPGMATEATPPQIPPTVQQFIALEAEELAQLRSVRDKATADAACARLRELAPLMEPLKRTWEVENANREGPRREDKTARERKAETERLAVGGILWFRHAGEAPDGRIPPCCSAAALSRRTAATGSRKISRHPECPPQQRYPRQQRRPRIHPRNCVGATGRGPKVPGCNVSHRVSVGNSK